MRKLLISLVILAGCVGSSTPRNPMKRPAGQDAWWRATTVGVEDNPWEIYVVPLKPDRWDDPWSTYKGPAVFPEDFKDRVDGRKERPTISGDKQGKVY